MKLVTTSLPHPDLLPINSKPTQRKMSKNKLNLSKTLVESLVVFVARNSMIMMTYEFRKLKRRWKRKFIKDYDSFKMKLE